KDREVRYQTPAELIDALVPLLQGGSEDEQKTREEIDWPLPPLPTPTPPRRPRPLVTWPRLIAGALLGGAVLGLPLAWLVADWLRPAPPGEPDWGPVFTNSISMELVRIEPGKFWMGSPPKEEDRPNEPEEEDDEVQHEVQLTKAFYLGAREVTQQQYR